MPPTVAPSRPRTVLRRCSITLSLLIASALAARADAPPAPGRPVAVEDTLHPEVPEVLVKAPRVPLDEILDRVARGEARRDSALTDIAFTATMRLVRSPGGGKPLEMFQEQ